MATTSETTAEIVAKNIPKESIITNLIPSLCNTGLTKSPLTIRSNNVHRALIAKHLDIAAVCNAFLQNNLGLPNSVQTPRLQHFEVWCKNEEQAESICAKTIEMYSNEKPILINFTRNNLDILKIRIHDTAPEVSLEEIKMAFAPYVNDITKLVIEQHVAFQFEGQKVYTDTWYISTQNLIKHLPKKLEIGSRFCKVFYYGQPETIHRQVENQNYENYRSKNPYTRYRQNNNFENDFSRERQESIALTKQNTAPTPVSNEKVAEITNKVNDILTDDEALKTPKTSNKRDYTASEMSESEKSDNDLFREIISDEEYSEEGPAAIERFLERLFFLYLQGGLNSMSDLEERDLDLSKQELFFSTYMYVNYRKVNLRAVKAKYGESEFAKKYACLLNSKMGRSEAQNLLSGYVKMAALNKNYDKMVGIMEFDPTKTSFYKKRKPRH